MFGLDLKQNQTNFEIKTPNNIKIKNNEFISKTNSYLINLCDNNENFKLKSNNTIKLKLNNLKKKLSKKLNSNKIEAKNNFYKCEICNKHFTAHYNLTRHMPIHTGARPFICKVNKKNFFFIFKQKKKNKKK